MIANILGRGLQVAGPLSPLSHGLNGLIQGWLLVDIGVAKHVAPDVKAALESFGAGTVCGHLSKTQTKKCVNGL